MRLFTEGEIELLADEMTRVGLAHGRKRAEIERRYQNRKWTAILTGLLGTLAAALSALDAKAQTAWTPEQIASFEAWIPGLQETIAAGGYDEAYDANGDTLVTPADLGAEIARINALPPPAGLWPRGAWDPVSFSRVIEVESGLARELTGAPRGTLVVVRGEAVGELRALARSSDERMDGCFFTAAPDEFGRHRIEVVVTRDMDVGFQGFVLDPGDDGYGARHTARGRASYSWCRFAGGVKGIAVTGSGARVDLAVTYCDFQGIHGGVSAGVYSVRGTALIEDSVFEQIGYPAGGTRPQDAILNHAIYLQWECVGTIRRCWMRNIASHAAQLRGGGVIEDCVAVNTANGFLIGHDKADKAIVQGRISRTVIEGTTDVDAGRNTGVCVWTERANVTLRDVVCANNASRGEGAAIRPEDDSTITVESVLSLGIPRVIDVDGSRVRVTGQIGAQGETRRIGVRPGGSAQAVVVSFVPIRASVPDLSGWPEPAMGDVGELVAELLGR